jgi:hypothetical protein
LVRFVVVAEGSVDRAAGAVLGGRQQVRVDAREPGIGVSEVNRQRNLDLPYDVKDRPCRVYVVRAHGENLASAQAAPGTEVDRDAESLRQLGPDGHALPAGPCRVAWADVVTSGRGTLIETDRCRTPGPTPEVNLWWSAKHPEPHGTGQRAARQTFARCSPRTAAQIGHLG